MRLLIGFALAFVISWCFSVQKENKEGLFDHFLRALITPSIFLPVVVSGQEMGEHREREAEKSEVITEKERLEVFELGEKEGQLWGWLQSIGFYSPFLVSLLVRKK